MIQQPSSITEIVLSDSHTHSLKGPIRPFGRKRYVDFIDCSNSLHRQFVKCLIKKKLKKKENQLCEEKQRYSRKCREMPSQSLLQARTSFPPTILLTVGKVCVKKTLDIYTSGIGLSQSIGYFEKQKQLRTYHIREKRIGKITKFGNSDLEIKRVHFVRTSREG